MSNFSVLFQYVCIFFNVKLDDRDIDKMYRLGLWAEDKARPLLVAFGNGEIKDEIKIKQKS